MRGKPNPFQSSQYALLGLLYEKPTHGYDLHHLLTDQEGIGLIWLVKMSNLYAQLEKLEARNFIKGIFQPGDTHPNRTEYSITKDGEKAFLEWLDTSVDHPRDFRQEFMLRYYFILKFRPDKVRSLIERQRSECQKWLANTKRSAEKDTSANQFKKSIVAFRINQIQSIINWLEGL